MQHRQRLKVLGQKIPGKRNRATRYNKLVVQSNALNAASMKLKRKKYEEKENKQNKK
jgi:hypothetical protein